MVHDLHRDVEIAAALSMTVYVCNNMFIKWFIMNVVIEDIYPFCWINIWINHNDQNPNAFSERWFTWRIWPLTRIQLASFLATYVWSGCQYYIVGTHLCIVQRSISLMAFIHLWMHADIPVAQIVLQIGRPLHILTQAMSNTCIHRSCHWNVDESKWNFQ